MLNGASPGQPENKPVVEWRFARLENRDEMIEIGELLRIQMEERGLKNVIPELAMQAIFEAVRDDFCFIFLRGEKIIGAIGFIESRWFWSTERFLEEIFCPIHPDHRDIGMARAIAEAAGDMSALHKTTVRITIEAESAGRRRRLQPIADIVDVRAATTLYEIEGHNDERQFQKNRDEKGISEI